MPHNKLNKLAEEAKQAMEEHRSLLFAEEAAGYVLQVYGRDRALKRLTAIVDHIRDHG